MFLNDEEKKMLDGEYGRATQQAMSMFMALGEIYDVPRMVPISSAHLGGRSYTIGGAEAIEWLQDLLSGGAYCRVFTTYNPGSADLIQYEKMGIPEDLVENQKKMDECYRKMGVYPIGTCLAYMSGNVPLFGEHFSWGGSAGATFVNSVFGARGNREGSPSALAASLTGVTPEYGLHITENRYGKLLVRISGLKFEELSEGDWSALGYFIGRQAGDRTPVVVGLPERLDQETIRAFIAPMPTGGSVGMCHLVGITPEAATKEAAFGGLQPEEETLVGPKGIQRGYELLNTTWNDHIDLVALGCPHVTMAKLRKIAEYMEGKKVHPAVRLWVATSAQIKLIAERMGLVESLEKSGAVVATELCVAPGAPFHHVPGVKTVATDTARGAFFIPGACKVDVRFGDTQKCLEAALTGRWKD
ncbi:MAG: aconitase X catalytic domain-containing protein [Deltaproteobacteria bacterium]|nr:aconitase X catalytic domain-containing protein [Deltaproteobacteria bacterium]